MGVTPAPHAVLTAYARYLIQLKARQLCGKRGFSRSDEQDVEQELMMRLLRKAHLFDASRGASPETFADRVIISEVKMILRDRRRKKRSGGFTARSLSDSVSQPNGESTSVGNLVTNADRERVTGAPAPDPIAERELTEAVDQALAPLPPSVVEIAKRMKRDSISAIARDLRLSRRQVYAAVAQIRKRFEDVGLGEE